MTSQNGVRVGVVAALSLSAALSAQADDCPSWPIQMVPAPSGTLLSGGFAASNGIAVGGASNYANNQGAAHVFRHDGLTWAHEQMLTAADGAHNDGFGTSVAAAGDWALIGAPFDVFPPGLFNIIGSAYVFHFNGAAWEQTAKLAPDDMIPNQHFGQAVAMTADWLFVGAPQVMQDDQQTGAVHVYAMRRGEWTQTQMIQPNVGEGTSFGYQITVDGDVMLVSQANPSLVRVYRLSEGSWNQEATLQDPARGGGHIFGGSISLERDTAVVGAPLNDDAASNAGAAYVFRRGDKGWALSQQLLPPAPEANHAFGAGVSLHGGTLAVSESSPPDFMGQRLVRIFKPTEAGLQFDHSCSMPSDDQVPGDLGSRAACTDHGILSIAAINSGQGVAVFSPDVWPDCDGNGVADHCDPDQNRNHIADACDIATGTSADCDDDGVPDEVEAGFAYSVDDGTIETAWGYNIGSADVIWLSQFTVERGKRVITHLAVAWPKASLSNMPDGTPATLMLYRDPDNDGNPNDAVLVAAASTTMFAAPAGTNAALFSLIPIPPTDVGGVGDSFFVGAVASISNANGGKWPAAADQSSPSQGRAWITGAPLGQADIADPGSFVALQQQSTNFALRAVSMDCNGNGVWDACDIASGLELDADGDGIPDACEVIVTCAADVSPPAPQGDGVINIDDLFATINAFGPCPGGCGRPCVGDVDGDCQVDVNDLFAVINAWGSCR